MPNPTQDARRLSFGQHVAASGRHPVPGTDESVFIHDCKLLGCATQADAYLIGLSGSGQGRDEGSIVVPRDILRTLCESKTEKLAVSWNQDGTGIAYRMVEVDESAVLLLASPCRLEAGEVLANHSALGAGPIRVRRPATSREREALPMLLPYQESGAVLPALLRLPRFMSGPVADGEELVREHAGDCLALSRSHITALLAALPESG